MIPAETITIDGETRFLILCKISMCETKGEVLDTLVIDQSLSIFKNEKCFCLSDVFAIRRRDKFVLWEIYWKELSY